MTPGRRPFLTPSSLLVLWSDSGRLTFREIRDRAKTRFPDLKKSKNSKYVLLRALKALVKERKLKKKQDRKSGRSYYFTVDRDEPEKIGTVNAILDLKPQRLPIRLGKIKPIPLVELLEKNLQPDNPLYKTSLLWNDRLLKGIHSSGLATVYSSEIIDQKEFEPSLLAEAYLHVLGVLLWRRIGELNSYRETQMADFARKLGERRYLDQLFSEGSASELAGRVYSGELRPEEEEVVQEIVTQYHQIERDSIEKLSKLVEHLQFNLVISFKPGELIRELKGFEEDLEGLASEHRNFILSSLARGLAK